MPHTVHSWTAARPGARTHGLFALCLTLLLTACGGGGSSSGGGGGATPPAAEATLIRVRQEPAGTNCSQGGVRVEAGPDADGNGSLSDSEVNAKQYVCGSDGLATLVRMRAEAPGANCANGGSQVLAGIDANRNSALEDGEVSTSAYVCNSAAGTGGRDSLVEFAPEPAGTICPAGGQRITAGLDLDGSRTLSPGEVTSLAYACNGVAGAPGRNSIMEFVTEPAGASCTSGGRKIVSGLDLDGSGTLSASEITATAYVCNGANGADGRRSLLAFATEPAGSICPNGGQRITSGVDADGNGTLDAGEVSSTAYVCNGAQGTPGTNGRDTLVLFTPEAAGSHCPYGGQRIDSGMDLDRSGTLTANEITSTSYVCSAAPADTQWVEVTTSSVQARANTGYLANSAANVDIILPTTPQVGDWIKVTGAGTGGWTIRQNALQRIGVSGLPGGLAVAWTATGLSAGSWSAMASSADGARLVAASSSGELYTSIDSGANWTLRLTGQAWSGVTSSSDGLKLVAVTNGGAIYMSPDGGQNWSNDGSSRAWSAIAGSADGSRLVATAYLGQIWTSADGGASWTARESNRAWRGVSSSSDGRVLAATTNGAQLYVSIDFGVTWTARATSQFWWAVASSADGKSLFATVDTGAIWASYDFGTTWEAQAPNRDWRGIAVSADGRKIVAATSGGYLYQSADGGTTWRATADSGPWAAVASSADGSRYVAGKSGAAVYLGQRSFYTTTGTAGSLSGGQNDALQLQYVGGGLFMPISYVSANLQFGIR